MNIAPIRRVLQALLPGVAADRRVLTVQHLGFACSELETLPAVLDEVGRELGVSLALDGVHGDVVLAEEGFVTRVSPQVLNAFLEDRPLVVITRPGAALGDEARRHARGLHGELVRQLRGLSDGLDTAHSVPAAVPAASAAGAGFDSGFDSRFDSRLNADRLAEGELDPDRAELLNVLRRGLVDPSAPPLRAGYGHRAALSIDFATGVAHLDELAEQHLRVTREVPYLSRGADPGPRARLRDLDLVVWDIALAAGGFRLLHSPVNWWRTPLLLSPQARLGRYTALPQHLEMARVLAAGPISPAELRRRCRVGITDLRAFLQASLFLGLLHWLPASS